MRNLLIKSRIIFAQLCDSHPTPTDDRLTDRPTDRSQSGGASGPSAYGSGSASAASASNAAAIAAETASPDHIDLAVVWHCDFPVPPAAHSLSASSSSSALSSSLLTQRRFGVHHLVRIPFRATAPPAACPLKLTVHCAQDAVHYFGGSDSGSGGLASIGGSLISANSSSASIGASNGGASQVRVLRVPVLIRVRNAAESQAASFSFETLPAEEEFDQSSRSFRARASALTGGRYFWEGGTRRHVAALPPGAVVELALTAVFAAPGSYNINRFRFNLEVEGAAPRVFFFPLQHWMHVRAAAMPPTDAASSGRVAAVTTTTMSKGIPSLDQTIALASQWVTAAAPPLVASVQEMDAVAVVEAD
jgi:hypothetical protein